MVAFRRETRYLVLKLKYLTPGQLEEIAAISRNHPPIECVVVESDWPIYDQVWDMIQSIGEGAK